MIQYPIPSGYYCLTYLLKHDTVSDSIWIYILQLTTRFRRANIYLSTCMNRWNDRAEPLFWIHRHPCAFKVKNRAPGGAISLLCNRKEGRDCVLLIGYESRENLVIAATMSRTLNRRQLCAGQNGLYSIPQGRVEWIWVEKRARNPACFCVQTSMWWPHALAVTSASGRGRGYMHGVGLHYRCSYSMQLTTVWVYI
jgi:hypothetical protein